MKKVKTIRRYTTQAAFDWSMKKVESISFPKSESAKALKMCGKRIKVVIKIYEDDE